jgi:hypothetical protein
LRKVDGLMGATILGDGRVAPIVDVAGIAALNLFAFQASTNVFRQDKASVPPVPADSIQTRERGGSAHELV